MIKVVLICVYANKGADRVKKICPPPLSLKQQIKSEARQAIGE